MSRPIAPYNRWTAAPSIEVELTTWRPPMRCEPLFIDEASISAAWATALCRVIDRGIGGLTPLVVSITDFDDQQLPRENMDARKALDRSLAKFGKGLTVETVAGTIFPQSFWRPGVPRDRLFAR